ncbi:MAG: DUF4396 domain-containing protein [Pseudomonadota bacterium]|nr:DUF4396 domain-containing protein [Pseudomonadota bacterium]
MLLWFVLTAMAVAFVAIDILSTPESPVLKWGFILSTAYTGPIGAFLYVLGCREPLPGLHERYTAVRWRQVLGSTMHCVAGDGVGILAGAVVSSIFALHGPGEVLLEYLLGFAFGWTIFQALFMRAAAGGSYKRSLSRTFIPELVSMNLLMAGMVPTMMILKSALGSAAGPASPVFWFVMSMALLVGFIVAYPINWWLVANHLKHGMMSVRRADTREHPRAHVHAGDEVKGVATHVGQVGAAASGMDEGYRTPVPPVAVMTLVSFLALAGGAVIAWLEMMGRG